MKIRTQFFASMSIFGILLVISSTLAVLTNRQTANLQRREEIATAIEGMARELQYLSSEYLVYGEELQARRWTAKWRELANQLSGLKPEDAREKEIIEGLKSSHQRLLEVFRMIAPIPGTPPRPAVYGGAFTRTSWSRIAVQNQEIGTGALQLTRVMHEKRSRLVHTRSALFIVLLCIFNAFFIVTFVMVQRRLLRSLAVLQAGTGIVGSGNLDHAVAVEYDDEIGELSQAFNRMTASLKEVTASKEELLREVSDRTQAEEALRESNERLKKVLEVETVGVMFWDLTTGRMTEANDAFLGMMGYSRQEVEAGELTWQTLTPPEYQEASLAEIEKFHATGRVGPYEKEYFRKDRTRQWLLFAGSSLGGNACVEFCVDISSRKQAEKALRESERRERERAAELQTIFDTAPIGLAIAAEATGTRIRGNRANEEMFGLPQGAELSLAPSNRAGFKVLGNGRELPVAELPMQRAVRGETVRQQMFDVVREDGGMLTVYSTAAPLFDDDGRPRGAVGAFLDITPLKKIEEALRASEEQFRVLTQNLQSGVALIDEHGAFSIVNRSFLRMFDIPDDADILNVNSRDWSEWQVFDEHGVLLDVDEHPVRKAALSRLPVKNQLVAVKSPAAPNPKWLLVSAEPLMDAQGSIYRIICTYYDISEQKLAEEALQKAHLDLAEQMEKRTGELREKEVLLKEIHHRVKNNLQVISSLVGLQADASSDLSVREGLKDVAFRVRSMALVHEKLYQSESLAFLDFAEYTRSLLGYLWRAHGRAAEGIELKLDLEPVSVPVDIAVPCALMLNELAGNSLKHAFPGACRGEVAVSLRQADGRLSLCVRDNGTGLPEDVQWQQPSTLGLRLVQMLGGQLKAAVELDQGGGTGFHIAFDLPDTLKNGEPTHG